MARSQSAPHWPDPGDSPERGDLKALRRQLISLLDQVEDQYEDDRRMDERSARHPARSRYEDDPRPEGGRREQALKSVRHAVERFNDRDDYDDRMPPNPQDMLRSAIAQIRTRQQGGRRHHQPDPYPEYEDERPVRQTRRPAPRHEDWEDERPVRRSRRPSPRQEEEWSADPYSGRAEDMAEAVTAMVRRMEGLEAHLQAQSDATGDIHEIAAQVEQLTGVVEMMAGAVGEVGQIKRIESQLAGLAEAVAEGQAGSDLSILVRRLDEVVANVDRIADLQVQAIGRSDRQGEDGKDVQAEAMRSIEASVRNIYDRIDSLERSLSISPEDLERFTAEMARFTEEMQKSAGQELPGGLLQRVDALNARLSQIEEDGAAVGALKSDVEALRSAVAEAVEPRFAAIEAKIENLHSSGGGIDGEVDIGGIESRLRQITERMDETGEQLSGLARLYSSSSQAPDYDAIAERVARRTSEEIAKLKSGGESQIAENSLDELEARLSGLFSGAASAEPDLSGVSDSIKQVDDRLRSLEDSLKQLHTGVAVTAAPEPGAASQSMAAPAMAPAAAAMPPRVERAAPSQGDAMPNDPNEDRPLNAPAYGDPDRVPNAWETGAAAQEADRPAAAQLAGEAEEYETPMDLPSGIAGESGMPPAEAGELPEGEQHVVPPHIDPEAIERPARPVSSLDQGEETGFREIPPSDTIVRSAPDMEDEARPTADRNTFIEAARRAAQRGQQDQNGKEGSRSLIGRALARFNTSDAEEGDEATIPAKAEYDKVLDAQMQGEPGAQGIEGENPSFLLRHRRPILLGATLVAVIFLTLNLINQRMSGPSGTPAEAPAATEEPAPNTSAPTTDSVPELVAPSVDLDSGPTGSISPRQILDGWTPGGDVPPTMPDEIQTGSIGDSGWLVEEGPVHLELPAVEIGPDGLREAAAAGDPRAQFEVAAIFTEGRAVPQDFGEAAKWYERSAAQGFAPAGYRLGNLYESGNGVEQDIWQARLWYQRAAEAGNRMSMHNLAALYASGQLGEQQFETAAQWFEQAAARGLTDSQFNLGMLYARGLGVQQDLGQSYIWFSLAALQGDEDAARARDDIAKSLEADVIAGLDDQVTAWRPIEVDIAANFAPIGSWTEDFDPGEAITDTGVVEQVQTALNRLGYDAGTADGLLGPKTREAISNFEQATGMTASGSVNPRLLAVLGSQPV